jgi:hypothetical protein
MTLRKGVCFSALLSVKLAQGCLLSVNIFIESRGPKKLLDYLLSIDFAK